MILPVSTVRTRRFGTRTLLSLSLSFFRPFRVILTRKGHGERFVLHILSQYFTNADSAAVLENDVSA